MGTWSHSKIRLTRRRAFYLSTAASFLSIVSFISWMALDAQYRQTIDMAPYYLGLKSGAQLGLGDGEWFQRMLAVERRWYRLGPRLILLAVIVGFATFSSILVTGQCLLQRNRQCILTTCILLLSWCGFLSFHSNLDRQFLCRRASSLIPNCKLAVKTLVREWPTEDGDLPGIGEFRVGKGRIPNYLFLDLKPPYPRGEQLGYWIERSDAETIHFGLLARANWQIVYHSKNTVPSSYQSSWGTSFRSLQSFDLDDGWFLVEYKRI